MRATVYLSVANFTLIAELSQEQMSPHMLVMLIDLHSGYHKIVALLIIGLQTCGEMW
jgi:hypothetical protein